MWSFDHLKEVIIINKTIGFLFYSSNEATLEFEEKNYTTLLE